MEFKLYIGIGVKLIAPRCTTYVSLKLPERPGRGHTQRAHTARACHTPHRHTTRQAYSTPPNRTHQMGTPHTVKAQTPGPPQRLSSAISTGATWLRQPTRNSPAGFHLRPGESCRAPQAHCNPSSMQIHPASSIPPLVLPTVPQILEVRVFDELPADRISIAPCTTPPPRPNPVPSRWQAPHDAHPCHAQAATATVRSASVRHHVGVRRSAYDPISVESSWSSSCLLYVGE